MLRAFIAIELPEALRQEIAALQSTFRATGADVKWVDPANLHLTLKFLGNIEEAQVQPISEAVKSRIAGTAPFTLSLEGIGAFPRTTSPRVIWVGVTQGREELTRLAGSVEEACSQFVLRQAQHERHPFTLSSLKGERLLRQAQDRPFSAHLTIGRTRSTQGLAALIKKLQVAEFRAGTPAQVQGLTLFQSALSPKGPTYTPLAEIPLG